MSGSKDWQPLDPVLITPAMQYKGRVPCLFQPPGPPPDANTGGGGQGGVRGGGRRGRGHRQRGGRGGV